MINITSSVKAEGDKPSKPQREGILYLLKDITLEKTQTHWDVRVYRAKKTGPIINSNTVYFHLFSTFNNHKSREIDFQRQHSENECTLPQLSDSRCDELHREADQVVFRTVPTKLLWSLHAKRMVRMLMLLPQFTSVGYEYVVQSLMCKF